MVQVRVKITDWPVDKAKDAVVQFISRGQTVERSMAQVGRTVKTYENWRADDALFRSKVDQARERRKNAVETGVSEEGVNLRGIDFASWRKKYLGYDTYPHMQQWIDVLEDRDPQPIPGCEFRVRDRDSLIINTPPGHTKSTTITVDYVTYRICMNPNVRVVIMSKRIEQARKFLFQIKQRLTSPRYTLLQQDFAPAGGFRPERGEGAYSQNMITVAGRDSDDKDPTVEVLGLKTQIYGTRADLIILDDIITGENAHEFEKQFDLITGEIQSRLPVDGTGKLLIVGTRLKPMDLYKYLTEDTNFSDGRSPWTYLRQPMVLEFAEDPKDWVTLWPYSTTPYTSTSRPLENGMYAAFSGEAAAKIRGKVKAAKFSLMYQQLSVSEDAVFKPEAVYGSVNRGRAPGILTAGAVNHPKQGGDGMWTIASMDPAMAEDTFVVVGKVDRVTKRRYIENAFVQKAPTPKWIRDTIKEVTIKYNVNEWVIEQNAFQKFLTMDEELIRWLANRGIKLVPHNTQRNKQDADYGVASIEPLFGTVYARDNTGVLTHTPDSNLIELPDPNRSVGIDALCTQLITWEPGISGAKLKQDGPMALWFWELRARIFLGVDYDTNRPKQEYVTDRWMTDGDRTRQSQRPAGFFGTAIRW